jgi:predicted O-linked N-acetylglucosamine transferase (SPINDLY family)
MPFFMVESTEQRVQQAEQLISDGLIDEAVTVCTAVLQEDLRNIEALFLLGTVAFRKSSWHAASEFFSEAVRNAPDNPTLLNNLGLAYLESGRNSSPVGRVQLELAVTTLKKALVLKPDYVAAWKNLGVAYRELGDSEGAYHSFTNGLSHDPANASLWLSLGSLYTGEYSFDRAIECYRRLMRLNPEDPAEVLNRLATLYCYIGKIGESVAAFHQAVACAPIFEQKRAYDMNRLFTIHYSPDLTPEQIADSHRVWGQTYFPNPVQVHFQNVPEPRRRLRIGYVSPDLRMNAVLFFIQPVLASHDPAQVEIFCYANVTKTDHATEQLRNHHQVVWRDIVTLDDATACQLIRDDRIDILVDLTGHGGDNRLPLFGLRPAPLQVTWIGYPDTTGLPGMDYRITDAIADPPGLTEHLHTEQLLRLPGCFLCYRPGAEFPDVTGLPLLKNDYITFGTMNNFSKINDRMVDVWCEILRHVPESRLMIRYRGKEWHRINDELSARFVHNGIAAHRLVLLGHASSVVAQLQAYHEMDIALDTSPYNGTTTTFESLFMGVPVVTLVGRSHVARVGASILTALELGELVAESEHEYVTKAVALAHDHSGLDMMRTTLRTKLLQSPLTDSVTFTRQLEQCYREIWQNWCRQQLAGMADVAYPGH